MMDESRLPLNLNEIKSHLEDRLDSMGDYEIQSLEKGVEENEIDFVWLRVDREEFRKAVKAIAEIQIPHLSVTSGSDKGEHVELIYHFEVNYGYPGEETTVSLKVHLPKDDLTIPTITDIVPGAVTTEREKQEFLGVDVVDIPDSRRLWLDENYPEDRHPWRWDEKGMEEMSRYVHDPDEASQTPTAEKAKEAEEGGGD